MTQVRVADPRDVGMLVRHEHLAEAELAAAIRQERVLVAEDADHGVVGWLRWGMFWDQVPFMYLLHILEEHRGRGNGRALVAGWETHCRDAGHPLVLTSTQSDESAQHFYRRLGYADAGELRLPGEAAELLLLKPLA